jgi:hypothetical protein
LLTACSEAPEPASNAPEKAAATPAGPRFYLNNETAGDREVDLTDACLIHLANELRTG